MFRCCFVFVFLLVSVYCQNCQSEFDTFHDCVKKNFEDQQNAMKQERQDAENKMKDNVKKCFSSNGCKDPNFDTVRGGGPGKGEGNGDFEKRQQCSKQMSDKARSNVEQCVQKTQPGFHFPAPQDHKQDGHPQGGPHGGFSAMDKMINDSCPDSSRQAVKSCMRDAWKNQAGANNRDEIRSQFQQAFNKTCQARDVCYNAMTPTCQTQYNTTKQTVCECAQKLDKSQMENDYNTCAGTNGGSSSSNGNSGGQGRFGQRFGGGSQVDWFIKRMCNTNDFCHDGFNRVGGGGRRFGSGHRFGHGH